MNKDQQHVTSRKAYDAPTFTVLDVEETTAGTDKGYSDDGGHVGYKKEGGTCLPNAEVCIPPRPAE